MEELKLCKEIIKKVKWYMERKDYDRLRLYLDEKEKYIDIVSKNEEAEYIDELIKDLK